MTDPGMEPQSVQYDTSLRPTAAASQKYSNQITIKDIAFEAATCKVGKMQHDQRTQNGPSQAEMEQEELRTLPR